MACHEPAGSEHVFGGGFAYLALLGCHCPRACRSSTLVPHPASEVVNANVHAAITAVRRQRGMSRFCRGQDERAWGRPKWISSSFA